MKRMLPLALALLLAAVPAGAEEVLQYEWQLKGILGRLAGLVLPSHGHGELRSHEDGRHLVTELEITSPQSAQGEFFLYGARMTHGGNTQKAWSAYRWRDEEKSKQANLSQRRAVDIASGIWQIRRQLPDEPLRMRIWSDGKEYPVVVERVGLEMIEVPAGTFPAYHFTVRGLNLEGERFWKGGMDLWLAPDDEATPLAIEVSRGFADLRLELLPNG